MPRRKKPYKPKIGDYVEIVWRDATSFSEWVKLPYHKLKLATCTTRGWIIHLTREEICTAASWVVPEDHDDEMIWGDITVIPKTWLKDIKSLEL